MKLRSFINIIGKTLFSLCILFLIIDNFSIVKISFHNYFTHFWGTYLTSFIFTILTSKRKIYVTILGIAPIIILSYQFLKSNNQIETRKGIQNSQYEIIVNMNGYRIMKKYYFLEKEIAKKESKIFFNSHSKIGIIHSSECKVKLLNESKKIIILEINTNRNGKAIDSLVKKK